jgi:acetyl-CoA acetyltransferase family protein
VADAVIVDVIRTAVGRRDGSLSGWHPADLAGTVLATLVERNDLDPALVDDVIVGCVSQVGAQGANIGRNVVLAAGLPDSVPGATVDRQDGSSQQAVAVAAQSVIAGVHDVVIAAGVEVTSVVPVGATFGFGVGSPFGPALEARYAAAGGLIPSGLAAELVAETWGLTRDDLDALAAASQQRAAHARDEGRFEREILPVAARRRDKDTGEVMPVDGLVRHDEEIRADTTVETLASLRPVFNPEGLVTAGNSAPTGDGAAAVLITSEATARRLGLVPRARFHAFAAAGVDARLMLTGPIPATTKVLHRAGLALDDIDRIEIHEGFAAAVLAWERELQPDTDRVNVNGGAIALGHPLGASGTRMLATLLCELERTGDRWGLQTTAGAGGVADAMVIECLR